MTFNCQAVDGQYAVASEGKQHFWSAQVIRTGMGFSEETFAELKEKLPQVLHQMFCNIPKRCEGLRGGVLCLLLCATLMHRCEMMTT